MRTAFDAARQSQLGFMLALDPQVRANHVAPALPALSRELVERILAFMGATHQCVLQTLLNAGYDGQPGRFDGSGALYYIGTRGLIRLNIRMDKPLGLDLFWNQSK